mgnify:CR=1 FL=1
MTRSHLLQTCVTAQVDNWIMAYARECGVGNRVAFGDCIHDEWSRMTGADSRTPATDPVGQNIFIRVALDALLTYHPKADLRERTIAANHCQLIHPGLVAPRPEGGEHGE